MKRSILVVLQIALLLTMCVPAAMADNAISMSLNKTTASIGDSVTATGTTLPDSWVPIKVLDGAKNIVLFDTGKADGEGKFSIDFKVPNNAAGPLTVVVGEGSNVATRVLNANPNQPGPGGPGGGSSGTQTQPPVASTTGSATVTSSAGGTISLGSVASITIPANALTGTGTVEVTVTEVTTPAAVPAGFRLAGAVYEFSVGGKNSCEFAKEVSITLRFDPSRLQPGETPVIYYYDESKQEWVNLGGTVSGHTVTVQVDHFTKFAVMAQVKPQEQPTLKDITGHWAENSIKQLVDLGASGGYPDGTFKPNNKITRAEFASIIVKAFQLEANSGKIFTDTAGHWARDTIATAAFHGVVSGYDADTFGPNDQITREQMAAMIMNVAEFTPATEQPSCTDSGRISAWARQAVYTAVKNGIIKGYPDNTIRPQGHATRAEAAAVIVNALPGGE